MRHGLRGPAQALSPRRALCRLAGAVLALASLAAAVAPTAARAGTYDVFSCQGPDGAPLSSAAWRLSTVAAAPGDVVFGDSCLSGGTLDVALASDGRAFAAPGGQRGIAAFTAPPGARIVGYTLARALQAAATAPSTGEELAAAVRERSPVGDSDAGCESSPPAGSPLSCDQPGDPNDPAAPGNVVTRSGLDLDGLQLWAGCLSDGCAPTASDPPARVRLFSSKVTLEDDVAPTVRRLSGSVIGGPQPLSGPVTLDVGAEDDGAGVATMAVAVDGGPEQAAAIDTVSGTCHLPYTVPQPCPSDTTHTITLNRAALLPGAHLLTGTVTDAAGNARPLGPIPFTLAAPQAGGGQTGDDGSQQPTKTIVETVTEPPPANGEPAVSTPTLRIARSQLVIAAGRTARLAGTLVTADGQPIAAATLSVTSAPLGTVEQKPRPLPSVRTDRAGRFHVSVKAAGAQRIVVSFAPNATSAATASFQAIVRSPASITLKRSRARLRRGQSVVLSGRLRGTGAAAKGAVVEMQAIVHGRFRTVASVHVAANGRYRWPYRFRSVTRDTIFTFRAVVERTPGWPWPRLHSRRVLVRVDASN